MYLSIKRKPSYTKKTHYKHELDQELTKSLSYLSPGTCHPLRGRAALQVTAHPGGGPAIFGALGFWQHVTALPALTQDHTVPVARTTAGRTLRTEWEMKKEGEKKGKTSGGRAGRCRRWEGAAGGHCGHKHAKRNLLNSLSRGQQLYEKQSQELAKFL